MLSATSLEDLQTDTGTWSVITDVPASMEYAGQNYSFVLTSPDRSTSMAVAGRLGSSQPLAFKTGTQLREPLQLRQTLDGSTWILAADERIPMDAESLTAAIGDPIHFIGNAPAQVRRVVGRIDEITEQNPEAATYRPGSIL